MKRRHFRISHLDSNRTARLKLLYLLPCAVLVLPIVGILEVLRAIPPQLDDLKEAWTHNANSGVN